MKVLDVCIDFTYKIKLDLTLNIYQMHSKQER